MAQPPRAQTQFGARQQCQVFAATDIVVQSGVNFGDPLGTVENVEIGDIYRLNPATKDMQLRFWSGLSPSDPYVAHQSEIGAANDPIVSRARYTFMAEDGVRVEALLLEVGRLYFVMPLSPMLVGATYSLLQLEENPKDARLANVISLSFARGTRFSLANGAMVPVEKLAPGMSLLTRDHGAQVLRHIAKASLRAQGAYAPVVITRGVMGNSGDLIVSQHHRMFLYLRNRPKGLERSELLIQARHLVDDDTIFIRHGGVTEWYSLIFDTHEIIYAEGIPVESLLVNEATISGLPSEMARQLRQHLPNLRHVPHFGQEAEQNFFAEIRAARLGKRPKANAKSEGEQP